MNKDSVMIRENVIYKIVRDITLSDGETFEIPGDCTLDFQGGKIIGGRVVFKNTKVLPFGCVITDYVKSQISGTFVKGQCFFDVELNKPIWWNGESWVEEQDKLVSGTNIKTINGESILGSGNIVISGGSSSDIYVLETIVNESGVVSAEEFEKIRQCKILVLSMYLGMMTIVLQSKVNTEDELSFGTTMFYSSAVLYSITFNLNEDGSAGWSLTNTQQYFKTINGESILGESEGDITISGGGSSSGGGGAYAEVSHGTGDTTFALTSNTFHVWDEVASLDLSFADETAGVANEYLFQFTSGATATTLTLPDGLKWANDSAPTIAENMIYQISVLKGLASVLEFSNKGLFPITLYYADVPNDTYAKVYQELINRGTSGVLEPGLLFVNYDDIVVEVTEYSYFNDYRGLFLYSFGDPVYYDIYLASDGSMSQMFND